MDISVVVPTIGRVPLLRRCLGSIIACEPAPHEVVVVDQSGGMAVAALIAEFTGHGIRRVECDGRGTARAMNIGLAAVQHDTVLVTHDDCTVAPDWVRVGRQQASLYPGGIVTGRVLPPDSSLYVPSTNSDPDPRDFTGQVTSGVLYPANMVASRRELQSIGGFDERPSLAVAEDNDLCYRWLVTGRILRYEPNLIVWHHDWRTSEQLVKTHIAYAKSQGGFYAKHLYAKDWRVLRLLQWDVCHGIRSVLRGAFSREPRWQDPYREMVTSLLLGVVTGLREARNLRRAERRDSSGSQRV